MRIKKKNIIFENRVKHSMPIPKEVKKLYKIFVENGFELYIVGGAVRDVLMNKTIKDYDLATDASPDAIEDMLVKAKVRTIGTGKNFGVINAYVNDEEFEIATFRADQFDSDEVKFKDFKSYLKSLNDGSFEKFETNLMK